MSNYLLILCTVLSTGVAAQKYSVEKGEVSFTSNAVLEVINASSQKVQGIIDPGTGQFAFIIKIQSFEGFNSNLQREHFNEKYMETDKYYDATFTGKIVEVLDYSKDGTHQVNAKGAMIIHGKKLPRTIPATMKIERGVMKISADFSIVLADHDIRIPQILNEKIATEILVKFNAHMVQK